VWLRKRTAGAASGGYEWKNDGDVIWVHDRVARDLLERPGEDFEEAEAPAGKRPPEEAGDARDAQEVAELAAADARSAAESPSGTRLNDGRWAQTDTKGDQPVHTGLRDTGAEFAPANVASAAATGVEDPHRTLTPGSTENKPVVACPPDKDDDGEDEQARGTERPKSPVARTDRPLGGSAQPATTATSGTNQETGHQATPNPVTDRPAGKPSTDKK
jgi:hypothetical protein